MFVLNDERLKALLDGVASDGRVGNDARDALRTHSRRMIEWRNDNRPFSEQLDFAKKIGDVAELQRLRGVKIDGEVQWTLDPALLARFGMPDNPESAETAAMFGFPDYPWAHDIAGNRIPLLSARFPRPQRSHRPAPPARDPAAPAPAYARGQNKPAVPPVYKIRPTVGHHGKQHGVSRTGRPLTPLVADLLERAARGPTNPKPVDRNGRPTFAAIARGPVNDPPELNG